MSTILIISILGGAYVLVSAFIIWNLLKKTEKYEDLSRTYADLFIQLKSLINQSDEQLKEIDVRGTFSSDDEIGWFFTQVKHIQEVLNQFNENL